MKAIVLIILICALLAIILAPIYLSYLLIIKWNKLKDTQVEPDVPKPVGPIIKEEDY